MQKEHKNKNTFRTYSKKTDGITISSSQSKIFCNKKQEHWK